jgi:phage protein U
MIAYGGIQLFASGPAELRPLSVQRHVDRRRLAGLDGELVLDMGRGSRSIVQTGRLQADTMAELQMQIDAIELLADGQARSLVAPSGRTYGECVLEEFELTRSPRLGRGAWCEYRILYRELTP